MFVAAMRAHKPKETSRPRGRLLRVSQPALKLAPRGMYPFRRPVGLAQAPSGCTITAARPTMGRVFAQSETLAHSAEGCAASAQLALPPVCLAELAILRSAADVVNRSSRYRTGTFVRRATSVSDCAHLGGHSFSFPSPSRGSPKIYPLPLARSRPMISVIVVRLPHAGINPAGVAISPRIAYRESDPLRPSRPPCTASGAFHL